MWYFFGMPAIHQIDIETGTINTTWEGDVADDVIIEAIKRYQEDIISKPEYNNYNEVVNFANVAGVKVTASGLRDLAKQAIKSERPGIYTKLAIIVKPGLAYSFANLYATYRKYIQSSNKEIQVFKNEEDALYWVSNKN
jgi:ribosomal protein S6